jgi:hypothetical protein
MTQPALEGVTTARAQEIRTGSPGCMRPIQYLPMDLFGALVFSLASSLLLATHADCLRPSGWRSEGPRP